MENSLLQRVTFYKVTRFSLKEIFFSIIVLLVGYSNKKYFITTEMNMKRVF